MDKNFPRLLDTLQAVPSDRKVSTSELVLRLRAQGHAVTPRTVQRDLEALAAAKRSTLWLAPDQKTQVMQGNHGLRITATVQETEQLKWWLLSFGERVEVLKPAALRSRIADAPELAIRRYSKTNSKGERS
jgi:predicted DNA-binding transcriptional regulator YafY